MNIFNESMNRQFGCVTSGLVLILPPIISIAVTLYLQRIIGPLGCIVIFPVVYVLSLFITIYGITYIIRTFEGTGKHKKEAVLEDRVRQLEQLVSKLAMENELSKKSRSKGPFDTTEEKNDDNQRTILGMIMAIAFKTFVDLDPTIPVLLLLE